MHQCMLHVPTRAPARSYSTEMAVMIRQAAIPIGLQLQAASAVNALQQSLVSRCTHPFSPTSSSSSSFSSTCHSRLQLQQQPAAASFGHLMTGWGSASGCRHGFRPQPVAQQCRHESSAESFKRVAGMEFKWVTLPPMAGRQEQYTHPASLLEELREGGSFKPQRLWSVLKGRMRNRYLEWQARTVLHTNIPGFNKKDLVEEIADIYYQVNKAQAEMQPDPIRDLVSKDTFIRLRSQADQRRKQGWDRVDWELLDRDKLSQGNIQRVRARALKLLKDSPFDWMHLTYCISSKQRFAAYKVDPKTGQETLVAGDPNQVLDVVEYCVFERKTRKGWSKTAGQMVPSVNKQPGVVEGARWRLIAWLDP